MNSDRSTQEPPDRLCAADHPDCPTVVVGLGNPVLSDDGVGLHVAQRLETVLSQAAGVEVLQDVRGGLQLMERLIGYSRAVVIDAIQTGAAPGTIHVLSPSDLPTRNSGSAHDASFVVALEMGRRLGAELPSNENIRLVGIEADDVATFSEECTPVVQAAIPQAANRVIEILSIDAPRVE